MNRILRGIQPLDYVLAGVLTAGGVYLMHQNMTAAYGAGLAHAQSTTTGAMLPFFVFVTLPILWRRRNILAVVGGTALAMLIHVLLFGWETRCGVALPLSWALAYAVARFAAGRKDLLTGMAGVLAVQVLVVFRDASISHAPAGLAVGVPVAVLCYGAGRIVQNRMAGRRTAAASAESAAA